MKEKLMNDKTISPMADFLIAEHTIVFFENCDKHFPKTHLPFALASYKRFLTACGYDLKRSGMLTAFELFVETYKANITDDMADAAVGMCTSVIASLVELKKVDPEAYEQQLRTFLSS